MPICHRCLLASIVPLLILNVATPLFSQESSDQEPAVEVTKKKPGAKPSSSKKNPNIKPDPNGESIEQWRIRRTVEELTVCIRDLRKTPHDFGGQRDQAIAAVEAAIAQLKSAHPFARTQAQVEAERTKEDKK